MLCITLGRLPSELRAAAKSSDITKLAAYFNEQPFGPTRDDMHSARIAAVTQNGFQDLLYSERKIRSRNTIQPHELMLKRRLTEAQKKARFIQFLDSKVAK